MPMPPEPPAVAPPEAEPCAVPVEEKVRFLSSPEAYPARPDAVTVEETHISWAFLAGDEAYKLKKPMLIGPQDYRTLDAREAGCREEVRLNRRLAPDVYLGVAPLCCRPDGRLELGGGGEVTDWLVRMRRLPRERMLDRVIARGALAEADLARLGATLAGFYASLGPSGIDPDAYVNRFRDQHAADMKVLGRPEFAGFIAAADGLLDAAHAAVAGFLEEDSGLLAARARQGRVVEGHADLKPEHVCLLDPPVIIDCLEFSRFLRLVDPFDEAAYLGLECALLGGPEVGERLRGILAARLHDDPPPRLTAFYTAFRACLRARMALAHLLDPRPRTPERWPVLARSYLELAAGKSDFIQP